jgi:hypothetical protein
LAFGWILLGEKSRIVIMIFISLVLEIRLPDIVQEGYNTPITLQKYSIKRTISIQKRESLNQKMPQKLAFFFCAPTLKQGARGGNNHRIPV